MIVKMMRKRRKRARNRRSQGRKIKVIRKIRRGESKRRRMSQIEISN